MVCFRAYGCDDTADSMKVIKMKSNIRPIDMLLEIPRIFLGFIVAEIAEYDLLGRMESNWGDMVSRIGF